MAYKISDPDIQRRPDMYVSIEVDPEKKHPFDEDYNFQPCLIYRKFKDWVERFEKLEVKSDDVWIVGFPKSGTTWVSNIVHALLNGPESGYLPEHGNHLEASLVYDKNDPQFKGRGFDDAIDLKDKIFDEIVALPSRRIIKSHLPAHLLPFDIWNKKPKIINIEREVKDVAVSAFKSSQKMPMVNFPGVAEDVYNLLLNDCMPFGPFYHHTNSYKQLKNKPSYNHISFITYEELKKNTLQVIKDISQFLDLSPTEERLQQIVDHVSFNNMSSRYPTICNEGVVGSHVGNMKPEIKDKFDDWEKKSVETVKGYKNFEPTVQIVEN